MALRGSTKIKRKVVDIWRKYEPFIYPDPWCLGKITLLVYLGVEQCHCFILDKHKNLFYQAISKKEKFYKIGTLTDILQLIVCVCVWNLCSACKPPKQTCSSWNLSPNNFFICLNLSRPQSCCLLIQKSSYVNRAQGYKTFYVLWYTNVRDKLDRLSLAGLSSS